MHLILGGRYMGKRTRAEKIFGPFEKIYDLEQIDPEELPVLSDKKKSLVMNLQAGVKKLLLKNLLPLKFFEERMEFLGACAITGDEISSGVIPVDKFERQWRDETGRVYQFFSSRADSVERVFAGLAIKLK
ncbi:MAG: bifunctional adenosylcobinamide kinase/adenosylcobinamide-phosphate guanylyltransferase [Synergistaceae bacterium]|nr:bifunctional adenosylcobinamide kinase/adenosylcobinamide-phosphate guanylyltransferase [Synergistaceae bacterium]